MEMLVFALLSFTEQSKRDLPRMGWGFYTYVYDELVGEIDGYIRNYESSVILGNV